MDFSLDGSEIANGSQDRTLQVWEATPRAERRKSAK